MDPTLKKRKADENGGDAAKLSPEDARKLIESFTKDQLLDIVGSAMCRDDSGVLEAVRFIADPDTTKRKLFIRGLGWETTNESLRSLFSTYGEIEEAVAILDKATGRSKGFGFITMRHVDGALVALKDPSKQIDGRITVTQLASAGNTGSGPVPSPAVTFPSFSSHDVAQRKVYIGNVTADVSPNRILSHFSSYGEIEEGPLGLDKLTGKFRGYTMFVYKTVEGARAALVDPNKILDGHNLTCKLANDGKKVKPVVPAAVSQVQPAAPNVSSDGLGTGTLPSLPSSIQSQFGVPGSGLTSFGSYPVNGGLQGPASGLTSFGSYPMNGLPGSAGIGQHHSHGLPGSAGIGQHHSLNSALQSSSIGTGIHGLSSAGTQVPSLNDSGVGGYTGVPYMASSQYGGPSSTGYAGLGVGSSVYGVPPSSTGLPSGGLSESGPYSLSSTYQSQHRQAAGSPPGRRFPTGGVIYPKLPPYY